MKRNKDKRVRGRFVISVLWKYMVFSIVLILLLVILLFVTILNAGKFQGVPHMKEVRDAFSGVSEKEFDSVDVEDILGKDGYVQILDEKNRVVYSSDPAHSDETYSDYELNYVTQSGDFSIIMIEDYERSDGSVEKLITVETLTEKGEQVHSDVYVVDKDLNILYSNVYKEKTRLTQREFQFLTDNVTNHTSLSKTTFSDSSGKEWSLLAFSPRNFRNTIMKTKRAYLGIGVTFLVFYTVVALLFSLWIASRVKKPLRMLNHAMAEISSGNRGTVVSYRGPKEFVEICENFNEMSLALDRAEQAAAKLEAEKQKMLADISHDLKTPITVIKGYSKAVADGLAEPQEQQKYLETIYQRSEDLTELIEEFHTYAKMEHPDNSLEFKPADLCEYVRGYFAEKYNEFDIGGYPFEADIDEDKIMVNLDGKKFRKVLENITGNFFKYCEPGSLFYCRVEEKDGKALLILADSGSGIPEDIRESLFEPFVVGEKSRSSGMGGSGLGLALARKIVEAHGGTLVLDDKAPEILAGDTGSIVLSSRFVITLNVLKDGDS